MTSNELVFPENFEWPSEYQEFIYLRTYSRWLDDKGRREFWPETVKRYYDFFLPRIPTNKIGDFNDAINSILNLKVMPSMRALWTAGKALELENLCGYNCSYLQVDKIRSFSEIMYLLMVGCGVGYSLERQFINQLPSIPDKIEDISEIIEFKDSKKGWAQGFYSFLKNLYNGKNPKLDFSKIRPAGSRLKTFGGRASGPEPLNELCKFILSLFKSACGRKLNSLECFDICCKISEVIVVGGSRRAACICLTNLSDERMRHAKDGEFWLTAPYRSMANISIAFTEKPSPEIFMKEWISLIRSKSGERGIFNREGVINSIKQQGKRDPNFEFGVNPCVEAILRPEELCNLTEAVIDEKDSLEELKFKVRCATILGVLQSTLTNFNFVGRGWKKNCEEERLLGVSLTGLADHEILSRKSIQAKEYLFNMRQEMNKTMKEWCNALEINESKQLGLTKPSGTISQLVNSSSGIHPRFSQYYIRRVRIDKMDPLSKLMIDQGISYNPEVGQTLENCSTYVFDFYQKSPKNARLKDEMSAIQQLEYWKMIKEFWCDGNPSCTIYVKENEWISVLEWIWRNWEIVCGLSFLPFDGGIYKLAPYEEITEEEYNELIENMPNLDFTKLSDYEKDDETQGAKEYACVGGACEI